MSSLPVPFIVNTFKVNDIHYHDDLGFVFVATRQTNVPSTDGESKDLRWLTIADMKTMHAEGTIPQNVIDLCQPSLDVYPYVPPYTRARRIHWKVPVATGLE